MQAKGEHDASKRGGNQTSAEVVRVGVIAQVAVGGKSCHDREHDKDKPDHLIPEDAERFDHTWQDMSKELASESKHRTAR